MLVSQFLYQPAKGWQRINGAASYPDLLLAFGSGKDCDGKILTDWWRLTFPEATLLGCSTAGEICDTHVHTNTIVVTAIKFEKTKIRLSSVDFEANEDSRSVGTKLASQLPHEDLQLCFVLCDGLHINGTRLVEGLRNPLPESTIITGGLAGDGKRFQETQVCVNEHWGEYKAAAIGFYGEHLDVQFGSLGGWDSFGPDRLITKSRDNQLFELDDRSALALYKEYLGDYAKELPASGLRFPLKITTQDNKEFVRTVLAVDENDGSMTFAGDIPEGAYAKLMRANYDRLIDGAQGAAEQALTSKSLIPELAILISCVGRRIVLDQRIEEEIEAVRDILGDQPIISGYYSYGEICPLTGTCECTLHNQTMTITTLRER